MASPKPLVVLAMVICACFMGASVVDACDCGGAATCGTLWNADLVFVGKVEQGHRSIDTPASISASAAGNWPVVTLAVEKWLRGEPVGKIVVLNSRAMGLCAYQFVPQTRYVVFANRAPNGLWAVSLCGGTVTLDSKQGQETLREIRDMLTSRAPGRVAGQVSFESEPVIGTDVRLWSEKATIATRTDHQGIFRFPQVPPGRYLLSATSLPNAVEVPPIPMWVGAKACLAANIDLPRRP